MSREVTTLCSFEVNGQTVIHGDALHELDSIPDESIHLVFADPPYNIGKNFNGRRDKWACVDEYVTWCQEWVDKCIQKLRPDGSFYLMGATQHMPHLDLYIALKLTILSRIVWHYDSSGTQARRHFGSLYEPILFAVKNARNYTFNADAIQVPARTGAVRRLIDYRKRIPTRYSSTKIPGNVWHFTRVRYRMPEYEQHPTQKPLALLERILKASSNPGDTILDPFAGTFTTSVAAKALGRKSIGIEIEQEYIKIGLRRLGAQTYNGMPLVPPAKTYASRRPAQIPLTLDQ